MKREYYLAHKEEIKKKCREYYYANREKLMENQRRYYKKKIEKFRKYNAEYRAKYREKCNLYHREWYAKCGKEYDRMHASIPKNRMERLARGARRRAKIKNVPFDDELIKALGENPPTNCKCCGRVLDYSLGRGNNKRDLSPSLDCTIPARGYTVKNVVVLCMRCNDLKKDATPEELRIVADYTARAASERMKNGK